jgi:hypothetical protein
MKKIGIGLIVLFSTHFYGQMVVKNMENVKYNYVTLKPFVVYDATKKNLDYLNYFNATNAKTSLVILYMLTKDSIQIVSGGKLIKEKRFTPGNSTSVRSIEPISNQKNLELLFFREKEVEKITITADDLKKYKFIYVSPSQKPIQVEFTNVWKLFM